MSELEPLIASAAGIDGSLVSAEYSSPVLSSFMRHKAAMVAVDAVPGNDWQAKR